MLLLNGTDPRAQDKNGYMPHHDAASQNLTKMLAALLARNRSVVNASALQGLTALHMAALENNAVIMRMLLHCGAHGTKRSCTMSTFNLQQHAW